MPSTQRYGAGRSLNEHSEHRMMVLRIIKEETRQDLWWSYDDFQHLHSLFGKKSRSDLRTTFKVAYTLTPVWCASSLFAHRLSTNNLLPNNSSSTTLPLNSGGVLILILLSPITSLYNSTSLSPVAFVCWALNRCALPRDYACICISLAP